MRFRSARPELPGFQLAAMLDVVFLLLCFFVTTSVYSQWENEVEIQLPSAESGVEPNRLPGEIIVNVAKDGAIRVNGRDLTPEELGAKCRALAAAFPGNGGFVIWAERAFGPFWGSLMGTWKFLSVVINIAAFPILCVDYLEKVRYNMGLLCCHDIYVFNENN